MNERLALRAMFFYLDALWTRHPDLELSSLLGDLQCDEHGEPFDPAVSHDWQVAVRKAMQELQ